jgi:hypothetical protein
MCNKNNIYNINWKFSIFIKIFLAILLFIMLPSHFVFAQMEIAPKGVAVFAFSGNNTADSALTADSEEYIKKIFMDCGRFLPAGTREIEAAFSRAAKAGADEKNIYNKAAEIMDLDIYVLVSVSQLGSIIYSKIEIVSLKEKYKNLGKSISLRSRLKLNMPLKIGREIALLHKNIPVSANIVKDYGDNIYLIDAGEWQGIRDKYVYKTQGFEIQTIQTGRYESIVKISTAKKAGDIITINIFPDTDKILDEIEEDISRNTVSLYGLDPQNNPEKRLLEGICVVNMGGNLCLPGYGAFLSTGYIGIKDPKPDMTGVAVSASAIALQLLLPELMTGFKANFLPWKQDSDKTDRMYDLQRFLWATLPLTYSVAFFDQLASQFAAKEILPPFFTDKDNAAAMFSLLIPGGGLFFKGYRFTGWSFYFSEMMTAGYGIYNFDKKSGKNSLYALCAIKLIDVIYAYMAAPSFSFYNMEKEREIAPVSINMGIRKSREGDNIYNLMITKNL